MTSKEALEILVKQANERKLSNKIVANGIAVSLLEELVDRDTPKKLKQMGITFVCPVCHRWLTFTDKQNFCSKCGQRLDWSELYK